MSLTDEYPKSNRKVKQKLLSLLELDTGLSADERREVAMGLNELADKARDLDDIFIRLLNEPHTPAEIGDLLIAFRLTLADIHGASDFVYGKLYDIGDRLRGPEQPDEE